MADDERALLEAEAAKLEREWAATAAELRERFTAAEQALHERHRETSAPVAAEIEKLMQQRDSLEATLHEDHTALREGYESDANAQHEPVAERLREIRLRLLELEG